MAIQTVGIIGAGTMGGEIAQVAEIVSGHELGGTCVGLVDLLPQLRDHDPRTGGELIDILHMAMETSVGTGDLALTLERLETLGVPAMLGR